MNCGDLILNKPFYHIMRIKSQYSDNTSTQAFKPTVSFICKIKISIIAYGVLQNSSGRAAACQRGS